MTLSEQPCLTFSSAVTHVTLFYRYPTHLKCSQLSTLYNADGTCASATLSTTNPTQSSLKSNRGLRNKNMVTKQQRVLTEQLALHTIK
jgi:hypothetical protein